MPKPNTPGATSSTEAINGYAVREIRKGKLKITPAVLAGMIGRDRTYVVKIETGAVDRVGTDTFKALVKALDLEDERAIKALPLVAELEAAS